MNARLLLPLALLLVQLSCNGNLLFHDWNPQPTAGRPLEVLRRGLWVVGGQSTNFTGISFPFSATLPAQIDVFDPVTETWYPNVTQLPIPVTYAGVAGYDGRLYVVGGWNAQGQVLQALQIYDLESDTWTQGAPLPVLRAGLELHGIEGGYLYATPGVNTNIDAAFNNQNTWYMYAIHANNWTARSAGGFPDASYASVRGIIHYLGGRTAAATLQSTHDGYMTWPTFANDSTTTTTSEIAAPTVRAQAALTRYLHPTGAAFLFLGGGMSANPGGTPLAYLFRGLTSGTLTNQIHLLGPPFEAPAAWVLSGTLPVALASMSMIASGNQLYVFGGTASALSPVGRVQAYRYSLANIPSLSGPVELEPMPVGRFGHRVVRINEFGGM